MPTDLHTAVSPVARSASAAPASIPGIAHVDAAQTGTRASLNKDWEIVFINCQHLLQPGFDDAIDALRSIPRFKLPFGTATAERALPHLLRSTTSSPAILNAAAGLGAAADGLAQLVTTLVGSARFAGSVRNFFCPGDTLWHTDEVDGRSAFRLLWPLGRPAGMQYTPFENVDIAKYRYHMARMLPFVQKLDAAAFATGIKTDEYLAGKPALLNQFHRRAFLKDPDLFASVPHNHASLHRVETPRQRGTFHANNFSNETQPGLQLIFTLYN
jgi:hypothetical protein